MNSIDRIKSVKQEVFDLIELKYGKSMREKDEQEIKDDIFMDNYCFLMDIYEDRLKIPMITELKIGILIFSEYDQNLLENIK